MTTLKIVLFGSPHLAYGDEVINLERRKAFALLAYLAVEDQQVSRDFLATMLWSDYDDSRARASLRRTLTVINKTPVDRWLQADRQTVTLRNDDTLWIDIERFYSLLEDATLSPDAITEALDLYQNGFMVGFSLRDSAGFDNWQSLQAQKSQQKLLTKLEAFVIHALDNDQADLATPYLRRWINIDPLHETAHLLLMRVYGVSGQRNVALRHFESYRDMLYEELAVEPGEALQSLYKRIRDQNFDATTILPEAKPPQVMGNLPVQPNLVIGRDDDLKELKRRVGVITTDTPAPQKTVIIQGWPGIGKTTLTSLLAHQADVHGYFRDGVLWASLGENPNIISELTTWGQALSIEGIDAAQSAEEITTRISAHLRDKQMLLIVDDAWQISHALPFRVGGAACVTIITTRMNDVATSLAPQPDAIYKIPILTTDAGLSLMRQLAPEVVKQKPAESKELIHDLEGLPLAIQVAARLLHTEMSLGWDIDNLLQEIRQGATLLEAEAPADRTDLANETTPTIAILLQRSTDLLDDETRERFALLGVFAPKPATFNQDAMRAVWMADNPRPTVRKLVDRGLLEPVGNGRFQMHALLVLHAKSMFVH